MNVLLVLMWWLLYESMFNSKIFNISTLHKSQAYHHNYPKRWFSLSHTFRYGNKMHCISTSNGCPKCHVSFNPQLETPEVRNGLSMSITRQYHAKFVFIVIIIIISSSNGVSGGGGGNGSSGSNSSSYVSSSYNL